MAIQTLHDTGSNYPIKSKMDGGVYGTNTSDCVCKGIGDEFALQYQSDSLIVRFNPGSQAVIGGSFFRVMSLEEFELSPNDTTYLCANINLGNPDGQKGSFQGKRASSMDSDNINGSGISRDMLLYVITTNGSGVTSVQDKRVIKGDGLSIGSYSIEVITQANYNALSTKDPNTLYFIY